MEQLFRIAGRYVYNIAKFKTKKVSQSDVLWLKKNVHCTM